MPSLLEIYKEKNSRQDKDNLEELTKLYNENRAYQSKYSFNEFVSMATKNSEQDLDDSILEILNPPEETEEIKQRPKMTMMGGNVLTLLPKDFRRTVGGIGDMVTRGTINAVSDAANVFNTFGQNELIEQQAKKSGQDASALKAKIEQRQRQGQELQRTKQEGRQGASESVQVSVHRQHRREVKGKESIRLLKN